MIPDTPSILRRRYTAGVICLAGALVLGLYGAYQLAAGLLLPMMFGLGDLRLIDLLAAIVRPALLLGTAAFLWFCQVGIPRWLYPIPIPRCPQCSYAIVALTTPRCPECGLALPRALAADDPA